MANSVLMPTDGDESSCSSSCLSVGTTKIKGQRMEYSHKLTEKRRRDRMNISMSEIAQLLPASTPTKQLEKAEILEKTIIYIKKLQDLTGNLESGGKTENPKQTDTPGIKRRSNSLGCQQVELTPKYFRGFSDCIKEVFHCLTNVEAMDLQEPCFQRLMGHLGSHLQFLVSTEEGQTGKQNKHDKDGSKGCDCVKATSDERVKSLLSSTKDDCCSRKRTADADQDSDDTFGDNTGKRIKTVNLDLDENSIKNDSCSLDSSSNSPKEESGSDSVGTNVCMGNGSNFSDGGGSSCGSEKRKGRVLPELPHPSKLDDKVSFNDGSVSMGGNIPLSRLGLDFPLHATPISPRAPYIPNPFCVPTYALHPAGTHFIPVLLHPGLLVRPFSDVNGCASAAVPNYPRLGGLQYPFLASSFSLFPHANAFKGTNGLPYTKDDSSKKQSGETDSSVLKKEDSYVNATNSKAPLNQEFDYKKKPNIQNM